MRRIKSRRGFLEAVRRIDHNPMNRGRWHLLPMGVVAEARLHEFCHLVTLGLPYKADEAEVWSRLQDRIDTQLSALTLSNQNADEVQALALEIRLLRKFGIGSHRDHIAFLHAVQRCQPTVRDLVRRVLRAADTQKTDTRVVAAIARLEELR